jgi:hypothetical protein
MVGCPPTKSGNHTGKEDFYDHSETPEALAGKT